MLVLFKNHSSKKLQQNLFRCWVAEKVLDALAKGQPIPILQSKRKFR
jgi:hypothetical protein